MSAYQAIRKQAGIVSLDTDKVMWRVRGSFSTEFLNKVFPGKVFFLQPGMALTNPLLNEKLEVLDIMTLMNFDDHWLVIGTMCSFEDQMRIFEEAKDGFSNEALEVEEVTSDYFSISIEGPYAWQVIKETLTPDVIGVRHFGMVSFRFDDLQGFLLRSGVSGEYGYRIFCDSNDREKLRRRLEMHSSIKLVEADQETTRLLCQEARTPVFGTTIQKSDYPWQVEICYMIDFQKTEFQFHSALSAMGKTCTTRVMGIKFDSQDVFPVGSSVFFGEKQVGNLRCVFSSKLDQQTYGYIEVLNTHAYPQLTFEIRSNGLTAKVNGIGAPMFKMESASVVPE